MLPRKRSEAHQSIEPSGPLPFWGRLAVLGSIVIYVSASAAIFFWKPDYSAVAWSLLLLSAYSFSHVFSWRR
jgi:hypothetical protein